MHWFVDLTQIWVLTMTYCGGHHEQDSCGSKAGTGIQLDLSPLLGKAPSCWVRQPLPEDTSPSFLLLSNTWSVLSRWFFLAGGILWKSGGIVKHLALGPACSNCLVNVSQPLMGQSRTEKEKAGGDRRKPASIGKQRGQTLGRHLHFFKGNSSPDLP